MPLLNLTPQWRWLVYPRTATQQRKVDAVVVADLMADLVQGKPSSWGGVLVSSGYGNSLGDWKRIGADLTITNAGFARFLPDGTVERFPQTPQDKVTGGFYVLPTERPTSAIVGGAGTPVDGTRSYGWTPEVGEWEISPASAGRGTGFLSLDKQGGTIRLDDPLQLYQAFEVALDTLTVDDNYNEYFLEFGSDIRLAVQQGRVPVIERRTTTQNDLVEESDWTTWRHLSNDTFNPKGERARFGVQLIGGRMVAQWNDKTVWLLDDNQDANEANPLGQRARANIPQFGNASLRLTTNGCRMRGELAVFDHMNEAGTELKVATVVRKVPLASAQSYEPRLLDPLATGFLPNGGDMSVSISHDEETLTYALTITPNADGLSSPMASRVYLSYSPVWVNGSGDPVDFTAAVTSGRVSLAQPATQAGSEGSVTVDLKLAAKLCPGAIPLLQDMAPFEVSARWINDTTGTPLTDYRGLMQGYLFGTSIRQPSYNTTSVDFDLRDPMIRLRDESGLVDSNFADLIYDFQRVTMERYGVALKDLRTRENADIFRPVSPGSEEYIPVEVTGYFGGDAIKYILGVQMGPDAANSLNGNGDPKRFLSASHLPLLNKYDMEGSIAPLATVFGQTLGIGSLGDNNGGFFLPPFGRDCAGWCQDIGKDDQNCVFFYGHVDRDTDAWPVPIYGEYEVYLDSAKGWKLSATDAINIAGMIEAASARTRPPSRINRVLVWANPFGSEIPGTPAFIQGEARIGSGPDAPHNSWARTLVLKDGLANWITTPGQAAAVAATVLLDIVNASYFRPQYTLRGDARWLVGDVFFASGLDLNINDLWVRAEKVEHQYSVSPTEGRTWKTELSLLPMTARQIARFQRNHGLETA